MIEKVPEMIACAVHALSRRGQQSSAARRPQMPSHVTLKGHPQSSCVGHRCRDAPAVTGHAKETPEREQKGPGSTAAHMLWMKP